VQISQWHKLVRVVFLLFLFGGTSAWAQNPALEAQSTAKIKKTAPKTWRVFGTLEHYFPVDTDQETVGAFYFIGSNRFSWGSLQVFQPIIKLYEVDPGEPEVQFADTSFRFFSNPSSFIDNWTFRYRLDASAPTSEFSRDNGVMSRPGFQAILETSAGKAYFSIRPMFRYFLNRFTTTVSEPGDGGGRPLRQYMAGTTLLGVYGLTKKLSAAGAVSYFQIGYEQTAERNENPALGASDFKNHQYLMDLSLSYQANRFLSFTGGYSIDSLVERYGGIEFVAYDQEISIWYLSATTTF